MRAWLGLIGLVLPLLLAGWSTAASAGTLTCAQKGVRRVALVIGESHYAGDLPPTQAPNLVAPQHDANRTGQALCDAGFAYVDVEIDRTAAQVEADIRRLTRAVDPATRLSLIYYSGHGAQVGGGAYLVPVGFDPVDDATIAAHAVPLRTLIDGTGRPREDLARIIIFDACRNDGSRETRVQEAPPATRPDDYLNLLIAWASTSGLSALGDGVGDDINSPYTWIFLNVLSNARDTEVRTIHDLVDHEVFEYERKHFPPDEVSVPELDEQIVEGQYYYRPPQAISARNLPFRSEIGLLDARLFANPFITPARFTAPVEGLATADLLAAAQRALKVVLRTKAGTVRVDRYGHPFYAPDFAAAAHYWRAAADRGSVSATRRLGDLTYAGRGVKQDYPAAVRLFRAAADQGDPYALERLGDAYRDGRGVAQDYGTAAQFYRRALAAGLQMANADLGYMYLNGYGVEGVDKPRALQYFQAAERAGAPEAHGWIGWIEWTGAVGPPDLDAALAELRRSAAAGDVTCMEYLAQLYQAGYGAPADRATEGELFHRALTEADIWYIHEYDLEKD